MQRVKKDVLKERRETRVCGAWGCGEGGEEERSTKRPGRGVAERGIVLVTVFARRNDGSARAAGDVIFLVHFLVGDNNNASAFFGLLNQCICVLWPL